jgi:GNAT superfamily N-acetyltransferase
MTKTWHIKKAIEQDAESLADCMSLAYKKYDKRMNGVTLPPAVIDYLDEIKNFPTWVIKEGVVVVAGLTMSFEKDNASLSNIAVNPSFQGNGLGRKLMTFAEEKARENGCLELRLATHVLLTENVDLYKYLGWVEYDRGDSKVYMKKRLHLMP